MMKRFLAIGPMLVATCALVQGQDIQLRTWNGNYVQAVNGGGSLVDARPTRAGVRAKLRIVDLNGGPLMTGDTIAIQACDGLFLCAEGGGGREVSATRPWIYAWEQFQVVSNVQGRPLTDGDVIGLRTWSGNFVCAENGGGSDVIANRVIWLGWEAFRLDFQSKPDVQLTSNDQRISRLNHRGRNLLTDGGVYLIGSFSGHDNPSTNCSSIGARNGRMTNGGPPFSLTFRKISRNQVAFRAVVGPIPRALNELSLAFDFQKAIMNRWGFMGLQYKFLRSSSPLDGSSGRYADIPLEQNIWSNGILLGRVGKATPVGVPGTMVVRGDDVRVRLDLTDASGVSSTAFYNHFATHNIGVHMRRGEGQTSVVEGTLTVFDE